MMFARHLRDRVRSGDITTSIRVWQNPRVRTGGRYVMAPGYIVVEAIREITAAQLTGTMARRSGFKDVDDLLQTARHGSGETMYFIAFR